MHLEGPCKPIDPGIEAAASFFNSTGRRKQKTRPLKIEISANGRGFLDLAYLEVLTQRPRKSALKTRRGLVISIFTRRRVSAYFFFVHWTNRNYQPPARF